MAVSPLFDPPKVILEVAGTVNKIYLCFWVKAPQNKTWLKCQICRYLIND